MSSLNRFNTLAVFNNDNRSLGIAQIRKNQSHSVEAKSRGQFTFLSPADGTIYDGFKHPTFSQVRNDSPIFFTHSIWNRTSGEPVLRTEISCHRVLRVAQFCFCICSPSLIFGKEGVTAVRSWTAVGELQFLDCSHSPPLESEMDCTPLTPFSAHPQTFWF